VEFSIKSGSPEKQRSACVVVGVFEPRKLTLAAELSTTRRAAIFRTSFAAATWRERPAPPCCCTTFPAPSATASSWSASARKRSSAIKEYCDAIRSAVRTLNETGSFDGTVFLTETSVRKRSAAWRVRQAAIVAQETIYRFDQFKSKKDKVRRPLRKLTFIVDRRNELAARRRSAVPRAGDRRRHVAGQGSRQPSRQRVHARAIWLKRRRSWPKNT
jgi:leucyl aminopeptidase